MVLPLQEAASSKYFAMLKFVKMVGTVEWIPQSTTEKMVILHPQLESALSFTGDSHPVSAFQIFGKN